MGWIGNGFRTSSALKLIGFVAIAIVSSWAALSPGPAFAYEEMNGLY